jgi:hypothetical protein
MVSIYVSANNADVGAPIPSPGVCNISIQSENNCSITISSMKTVMEHNFLNISVQIEIRLDAALRLPHIEPQPNST